MSQGPDEKHDARLIIDQLRDVGLEITFTVTPTLAYVHATDTDGQVYIHARDDSDLLAAVCEAADWFGYDFG